MLKQERLPPVDWMVGTGLVAVAILSIFYGSPELSSNVTSGLIGFLGRSVISKKERETNEPRIEQERDAVGDAGRT